MRSASKIIAITGQVGAGKSSLASALTTYIDQSCILDVDLYMWAGQAAFPLYEHDDAEGEIAAWVARGAAAEEYLQIPPLREHLIALQQGEGVTLTNQRGEHRTVGPCHFLLFESHFGRDMPDIADLIDVQIHIDVPLDISLSRKLMQISRTPRFDLTTYLNSYLRADRLVLERMKHAGRHADITVNGIEPVSQLAKQVVVQLGDHLPDAKMQAVN